MRRSSLLPMIASLTGALAPACGDQSGPTQPAVTSSIPAFARASQASVSGHIERDFPDFGVPVEKFSFHAHDLGNGSVEGRWQLEDFFADGPKEVARGRVTCFTVEADGRTARMGGIVEASTNPINVGGEAVWTVVDNGEGANAPPDQATDLRNGPTDLPPGTAAVHCEVGFPPEVFGTFGDNLRANVQVQP
jgi:hypothetical protein